jgi:nucleotide-binding universal stress UspA family protein
VKIKPLLARLQSTIGRNDLIEQMVLIPEPQKSITKRVKEANSINLIVGYDASPNSHTALDIAFCIAHQTHLATNTQVTVQAVYVVENKLNHGYSNNFNLFADQPLLECPTTNITHSNTLLVEQPKLQDLTRYLPSTSTALFHQADKILWQAKSLAEEWQGSFKSHLRWGNVGTEFRKIVESEAADILFLGCQSIHHPLIHMLGHNFPCAVVGIPSCINE